jgi:excisionase family DNA binding protein
MTTAARKRPVPRLALTPQEVAESLGLGVTTVYEQVLPEVRTVYVGRKRLVPVTELQRWLDRTAIR